MRRLINLVLFMTAAPAHAADFGEGELAVVLAADAPATLAADELWDDACAMLADKLAPGKGPYGFGVFPAHSCHRGKTDAAGWQLRVSQKDGKATVALYAEAKGKPLAQTSFEAKEHTLRFLGDEDFAELVAADLLDQLPAALRVAPSLYSESDRTVSLPVRDGKSSFGLPPPPAKLALYELEPVDGTRGFRARKLAEAKRYDRKTKSAPGRRAKVEGELVYKLSTKTPLELGDRQVWAHSAAGRRSNGKALKKALKEAEVALAARFDSLLGKVGLLSLGNIVSGSVSSGFVGLRYGHSIFRGAVIEDISMIGLLVELRGAPLDGLRFYFDSWPTVNADADAGAILFKGSRAVFGWSFGLDLGGLVDRVDLVPKIGRWSVRTVFADIDENGERIEVPFDVSGALSLGIEAGAESSFDWMLMRFWVARDFGYNPFDKSKTTTVTNTRAGLDALVRGPVFGLFGSPVSLSFLGFALYENVDLRKKKSEDEEESVTIDGVTYNVGYLGGGFALAW